MKRFLQIFRVKDIRKKVFIVLGLLVAFRALAAIPIPGVDIVRLREFLETDNLFGFLNIFSGGSLSNLSIVMLGVAPYITASIIMQLLTIIFPKFKRLYFEEGARGQAKFNQYSRLITVPLAIVQAYGFLNLLISQGVMDRPEGLLFFANVAVVVAGTMIVLWLGELIGEQKIGNGISLIILAGIVSGIPSQIQQSIVSYTPDKLLTYIGFLIVLLLMIFGVVFLNEGERKIPIAYARRVRGMKLYGGASSYLPLKVNQAGMIPLIFAISVLLFPQFFAQVISIASPDLGIKVNGIVTNFFNNQIIYGVIYFTLVFVFTYFYTSVTFDPKEISKNLQRGGGFIPGIRPGDATSEFIRNTIKRLTFLGAVFLGLIAISPLLVQAATGAGSSLNVSGAALLIVVAVALETMRQIDSQLTVREYDGIQ